MKSLFSFAFILCVFFSAGFAAARLKPQWETLFAKNVLEGKEPSPFKPAAYPLHSRPFVVIVIGYNNGATIEKTLRSVFFQNYENFRLIYVDDASDDGSFEHAQGLIYDQGGTLRFELVQNTKHLGEAESLFRTARTCDEEEIVVVLQGSDLLAHEWVLQRLNQYYANSNLWMAEGKGITPNEFQPSSSRLQTFYASLLKKIPETESFYFSALADAAKDHIGYANEVLFLSPKNKKEVP